MSVVYEYLIYFGSGFLLAAINNIASTIITPTINTKAKLEVPDTMSAIKSI